MENNITFKKLSAFGYSNYILTIDGRLYKNKPAPQEIKKDSINRFYIVNDDGAGKRISIKRLYRQVFNAEYCEDNI